MQVPLSFILKTKGSLQSAAKNNALLYYAVVPGKIAYGAHNVFNHHFWALVQRPVA